jgi:hypothetical protein
VVARKLKLDAVVWGSFSRSSNDWALEINLLRKPFTNTPIVLELKQQRMATLLAEAPLALAERLATKHPPGQREKWLRHGDGSNTAWDGLSRAVTLDLEDGPEADQEKILRQVLADEPKFVMAQVNLAWLLSNAEAEAEWRRLIHQAPDLCSPHEALAWVLKEPAAAEAEAREALRLQPGCPRAFEVLVSMLHNHHRWQDLRELLEKANQEHPGEILTLAFLAVARLQCEDQKGAWALLEQLGDTAEEQDSDVHAGILEAALACGDMPRFAGEMRWFQERGKTDPQCAKILAEADASAFYQPKEPFSISQPRAYTTEGLRAELQRLLTPAEQALVVNPVEITPEIAALAKQITGGLTNPVLKALLLFAEVAQRGRGAGDFGARTAQESFQASQQPEGQLSCQEFAKLFVALSRAVGLEAWLVHVDEDVTGRATYHDCAALILPGQALLVDPTWRLFFVPHRRYRVLDDLQATAHHAMQPQTPESPPRLRVGAKLDPADTWTRLHLVCGLANADLDDEAEIELRQLPASETNRWDFWLASAAIRVSRKEWSPAVADLEKALTLSPSNFMVHAGLGKAYAELKDVTKAREHAEAALRLGTNQVAAARRQAMQSEVNYLGAVEQAQAAARSPGSTSREALRSKAQAGDTVAQLAFAKVLLDSKPPQLAEAVGWLRRAADSGDPIAQENYARHLLLLRGPQAAPEALRYVSLSAEQGYSQAQGYLGQFLYEGKMAARDEIAACQWTLLASQRGYEEAKSLLKEMQLFLTKEQLAEGQRRADAFKPKQPDKPKTN